MVTTTRVLPHKRQAMVLAIVLFVSVLTLLSGNASLISISAAQVQAECETFTQTGKTVCGQFLVYWKAHGGLAQQGFPISGEMQEKSDTDGKTYTVQYFERAAFEL